eukprot:COSAG06_NODE_364_length_16784_cov_21.917231_6_plen_72_part_00
MCEIESETQMIESEQARACQLGDCGVIIFGCDVEQGPCMADCIENEHGEDFCTCWFFPGSNPFRLSTPRLQ